jgi:hypothetical protein
MNKKMEKKIRSEIATLEESVDFLREYSDEDSEFDDIEEQRQIKDAVRDINSALARLDKLVA